MCVNGDAKFVVPRLKQEITKGMARGILEDVEGNEMGFFLTPYSVIEASGNDDFQPPPQLYEAFPHFNSYDSYAAELIGCF